MKRLILVVFFLSFMSDASEMKLVRGGSFVPLYGAGKPSEPIEVRSFQTDVYPVTNRNFLQFVRGQQKWLRKKIPKIFADLKYLSHWAGDLEIGGKADLDSPVVFVSWFAANAYCHSKNKRLMSVFEWEFAAKIETQKEKELILNWYGLPNL